MCIRDSSEQEMDTKSELEALEELSQDELAAQLAWELEEIEEEKAR